MQYVNLLGMHAAHASLTSFAAALFDAFGITNGEERESGNYVDGYYLKGSRDGMEFTIARSDDELHIDLPYWISVTAAMAEPNALEARISQLVRVSGLPAGFRLARIVDFGKRVEQRIDYS